MRTLSYIYAGSFGDYVEALSRVAITQRQYKSSYGYHWISQKLPTIFHTKWSPNELVHNGPGMNFHNPKTARDVNIETATRNNLQEIKANKNPKLD